MRKKRRDITTNALIAISAAGFMAYYYSDIMPQCSYWFSCVMDCLGFVSLFTGIVIRISARGYKTHWLKNHNTLVRSGPYALVRNPMYLGSFLIGLGLVIALATIWMIPAYVLFYVLWYWPQIHRERNHLIIKFGQDYLDYENTVPCFFPRFHDILRCQPALVIPMRLFWIRKELPLIITMLIVLLLSDGFVDVFNFGWQYYFVDLMIISTGIAITIVALWLIFYKTKNTHMGSSTSF